MYRFVSLDKNLVYWNKLPRSSIFSDQTESLILTVLWKSPCLYYIKEQVIWVGLEIKILDILYMLGQTVVASCAIISLDTYAGLDGLPCIWFSSWHLIFLFSKSRCQIFPRYISKVSCDFYKSGHQPSDLVFLAVDVRGVCLTPVCLFPERKTWIWTSFSLGFCCISWPALTFEPRYITTIIFFFLFLHHHFTFHLHLGSAEANSWTVLNSEEHLALMFMVLGT